MFNKNIVCSVEDIHNEIQNLELVPRIQMIGNEGILDSIGSVSLHINKGLEGITSIYNKLFQATEQLHNTSFLTSEAKTINLVMGKLRSKLETDGYKIYGAVSAIELPVPLGLKVDGLKLLQTLKPCLRLISTDLIPALQETSDFVTKLISSEDTRTASRISFKTADDFDWRLHYHGLNLVIDANGTKDRMRFDNFFKSMKNLDETVKLILEDEKLIDVKHLEAIKKLTLDLSESSELLYKFIKENPDVKVNKQVLLILANRLENMAEAVTSSMSTLFLFKAAMETTTEALRVTEKNM